MALRKTGYSAGEEVDSKCTKCKMVLAHVIVAMVGDQIARVKCNTCNGEHAYRPPPSASEATAKRRRAERKAAVADATVGIITAEDYENVIKGHDLTKAAAYSMKTALTYSDVVDHPKFGIGVVVELREGDKAQIAFPTGGKVLVHSRE
jgi:hypothetical protein